MSLELLKRPYRRRRAQLLKARRRLQGDLELVFSSRNPDRTMLKASRNRHRGMVGFLIGNGPSVRPEDLDQVRGRVTFCCNRFYLAYGQTELRPTYLCSADPFMIRDFGAEMISRSHADVVFLSTVRPDLPGIFQWIETDSEGPFRFTRNVLKPLHVGGGTLIGALQFGYWMGIRRFVLYGVDHSFPKEKQTPVGTDGRSQFVIGDGNHFIPSYRGGKPWVAPWTETIEAAFALCDSALRREGGWLINASRVTHLPEIERIQFDSALERATDVPE